MAIDSIADDFGSGAHRFRDPLEPGGSSDRLDRLVGRWRPDRQVVAQFRRSHFDGDPAADALVRWMHATGLREGRELFERALEHGIEGIPQPPEPLRAFFGEIDSVPSWLDHRSLVRACRAVQRFALWHDYVLFSVSLLGGYASAGITKTLAATGELEAMAPRRIAETAKFIEDLYDSPGLCRTSKGFKSAVRVRLMHAFVRDKLLRDGWETDRWGLPINQADMAGTVLSFSVTYLIGLRLLGFLIPRRDREALIHFWRYTGRLLGVRDSLLPENEKQSLRFLWLVASTQEGPDDDGRALARALLGVPRSYRGPGFLGLALATFDTHFTAALTRVFVGEDVADGLGIGRTPWRYAVPAIAATNLCGELVVRSLPQRWHVGPRVGRVLNAYRRRTMLAGRRATFEPRTVATAGR